MVRPRLSLQREHIYLSKQPDMHTQTLHTHVLTVPDKWHYSNGSSCTANISIRFHVWGKKKKGRNIPHFVILWHNNNLNGKTRHDINTHKDVCNTQQQQFWVLGAYFKDISRVDCCIRIEVLEASTFIPNSFFCSTFFLILASAHPPHCLGCNGDSALKSNACIHILACDENKAILVTPRPSRNEEATHGLKTHASALQELKQWWQIGVGQNQTQRGPAQLQLAVQRNITQALKTGHNKWQSRSPTGSPSIFHEHTQKAGPWE